MKTIIFTAIEWRRLEDWLKGGMENRNLQKDFVKVRRAQRVFILHRNR